MNKNTVLSVVIAIYNEANQLPALIKFWAQVFINLQIQHQFIFLNDGSTDNSLEVLEWLAVDNTDIKIYSHENRGHGPTILKGYKLGIETAWIFQIDADNPYNADAFIKMWKEREGYDFLVGHRIGENAGMPRKILSVVSVLTVKLLCGRYMADINTPYRLLRSSELIKPLEMIPSGSFAPNIMVALFYLKKQQRIFVTELHYKENSTARKSRMNSYFAKGAILSFFQIIQFRLKL